MTSTEIVRYGDRQLLCDVRYLDRLLLPTGLSPLMLRTCYAMSDTEVGGSVSRIVKITEEFEAGNTGSTLRSLSKLGAAQVNSAPGLRACYEMPGTDVTYRDMKCPVLTEHKEERAVAALMAHVTATKQDFSPQVGSAGRV
eukprot:2982192-Rhodomonas_salina.5